MKKLNHLTRKEKKELQRLSMSVLKGETDDLGRYHYLINKSGYLAEGCHEEYEDFEIL